MSFTTVVQSPRSRAALGRFVLVALAVACVAPTALAQKAPVTVAEANAVFTKIDNAVRDVLQMKRADKRPVGEDRPITRAEVVQRMESIFRAIRPKFQFTPRPFRREPGVISRFNPDPKTQERMETLVRWGFLAPVGPLVVGPEDSLSIAVFGDAVGYFLSQMAAMTYFADPNWVPALQPVDRDGG